MVSKDRGCRRMAILGVAAVAGWLALSGRLTAQGGATGVPAGRRAPTPILTVQSAVP